MMNILTLLALTVLYLPSLNKFRYNALVFIDECHATGFLGNTGRGTEEYFEMKGRVDIINSTLGKALGGAAGGYTSGNKELIDLLRQRARPYLFSNSLPPPVVACASKVKRLRNKCFALHDPKILCLYFYLPNRFDKFAYFRCLIF